MIHLNNLHKSFTTPNGELEVLSNINLHILKGEIFGIIGLSGAGKSTLVRCINFLEKPTKGEVIFDGENLENLSDKQLREARRSMGMIFQGFNLLSQRNALDNVCFPLEISGVSKSEARVKAKELLELVGISDKAKAYPSQLSGGQKQRVAIARALATNPKVLLCDEATSALDPNTTQSILEMLQSINQKLGVTIVIVTHEMKVIEQICHRVAVIDKSEIIEVGDVAQIFINPKSEISKQLILPKRNIVSYSNASKKCVRIVFDGISTFEPIISNMVLECNEAVNILYADTKTIEGKTFGEMVIQLPDSETSIARILAYLDLKKIFYKEEEFENATKND